MIVTDITSTPTLLTLHGRPPYHWLPWVPSQRIVLAPHNIIGYEIEPPMSRQTEHRLERRTVSITLFVFGTNPLRVTFDIAEPSTDGEFSPLNTALVAGFIQYLNTILNVDPPTDRTPL